MKELEKIKDEKHSKQHIKDSDIGNDSDGNRNNGSDS
jgi:hypothetical protein